MNGAEHYNEAERLVEAAEKAAVPEACSAVIAVAQVHATLALAAATEEAAGPTCPHGTRGFCMYCVLPLIEDALCGLKR